jgi:hypothetical protein
MKIIASKKNRVEKGIRAVWFGSNPHSNGDNFSRSLFDRIDSIYIIIKIALGTIIAAVNPINIIFIN